MIGFEEEDDDACELAPYLDLRSAEIARIILCLLLEEALRGRLEGFREARVAGDGDVPKTAPLGPAPLPIAGH
ncbi:hypothetical protein [Singulisphaera sp. PoT]|uniref:hypothetical protein n=1 Tax=Singulisphaera sp. PoT TaxID=3411797 RepID=UPI003BF5AC54